ncbi:hypothetical protein WR25_03602 [Diploscapter pachys]|uniref:Uncharacterized protein n=1 Tax=Diploscapter pachys TaxID=2018661 RepID=A0A2A2J559_9BILA|nr:hypothetical protein WR25_03602 [Diploscapter pachys]
MASRKKVVIDSDELFSELKASSARQMAQPTLNKGDAESQLFDECFSLPNVSQLLEEDDADEPTPSNFEERLLIGEDEIKEAMEFVGNDEEFKRLCKDKVHFGKTKNFNGGRGKFDIPIGHAKYLDQSSPKKGESSSKSKPEEKEDMQLSLIEHALIRPTSQSSALFKRGLEEYYKEDSKEPCFDVLIAWLAHAARCRPSDLLPSGEIFPRQDAYIRDRLARCTRQMSKAEFVRDMPTQISRVLTIYGGLSLSRLTNTERSFLLYAVLKITRNMPRCLPFASVTQTAIKNIFNSTDDILDLMLKFSEIFVLISDHLVALRFNLQQLRVCCIHDSLCLLLLVSVLIHFTERGECAIDNEKQNSIPKLNEAYFKECVEMLPDAIEVFSPRNNGDVDSLCAFYHMLDMALTADLVKSLPKQDVSNLMVRLVMHKKDLAKHNNPDTCLLDLHLRCLMRRLEIDCNAGVEQITK